MLENDRKCCDCENEATLIVKNGCGFYCVCSCCVGKNDEEVYRKGEESMKKTEWDRTKMVKGDKFVLIESKHSANSHNGHLCEVISEKSGTGSFSARDLEMGTGTFSVVNSITSTPDDIVEGSREQQAELLKIQNKDMAIKVKANKIEIERLLKFDTDEAYAAYKIMQVVKTATKAGKGSEAKLAVILKEMKASNYL